MFALAKVLDLPGRRAFKPAAFRLFRVLLYLWFLLNLMFLIPVADLIWGKQALLKPIYAEPSLIRNVFYFLNYMRDMYPVVLIVHGFSALLAMFGLLGWVPRLLVYITAGMMYYSAYLAFNSGFILMWLLSFYMIFAANKYKDRSSLIIRNFALLACITQFLLVYFFAAWWKWTGSTWIEGSSLFRALSMDHFSRPFIQEHLLGACWLLTLMTWAGLAYQTLFPALVWIKRFKHIWLLIGVAFHLFIVVVMGLYDFGTAMIFGYSLFLNEDLAENILRKLGMKVYQSRESTMDSTE